MARIDLLAAVVLIPLALILLAALGGVAIGLVFNVSATATTFNASLNESAAWNAETVLLWNLMPIIAIVVIFIAFLAVVGLKVTGRL